MRSRWSARAALAATAALALFGGCAGEGQAPDGAPDDPATAEADLGRCGKHARALRFRCASLQLPLERAEPGLGTVRVSFAVRQRREANRPSKGAIFAVEGGPGYGSIGSARSYINLFGDLLDRRELVLVDMRGTGHSGALECRDLQRAIGPDWLAVASCARRLGPRFAAYRTAAAADDLDAVRESLGLDRISLYGDSYGTYLAQSYAFRHPETLDALVLDSAYPVRGESGWYPSLVRTGIRSLAIACDRSRQCAGNARLRLERFVAELRRRQRSVGPLLDAIGSGGYSPPQTYLQLNRAIEAFLGGDPRPYERLTRRRRDGFGPANYYSHADELAVSCNDYPMIWDKTLAEGERRAQLEREIQAYPEDAFDPFTPREVALAGEFGYLECLTWPPPGEHYEPPAASDASPPEIPVLVIAGELDDVTSPSEGRATAALFPNARYLEIRNGGHVTSLYGNRYSAAAQVRQFLRAQVP